MMFTVLMNFLTLIMKYNVKTKKNVRDMIAEKNYRIVMKTRDGQRGRRFILKHGDITTDDVLDDYDLAFIWRDGATAFKVMTANDPVAMHKAIANWDLEMTGDESLSVWFTIFLGYATGVLKRKE